MFLFANFNSIKVQLEQNYGCSVYVPPVFQFHKGTIRTLSNEAVTKAAPTFQFHKGTIRTLYG